MISLNDGLSKTIPTLATTPLNVVKQRQEEQNGYFVACFASVSVTAALIKIEGFARCSEVSKVSEWFCVSFGVGVAAAPSTKKVSNVRRL